MGKLVIVRISIRNGSPAAIAACVALLAYNRPHTLKPDRGTHNSDEICTRRQKNYACQCGAGRHRGLCLGRGVDRRWAKIVGPGKVWSRPAKGSHKALAS